MKDWWSGQGNHPFSPSFFPLCPGKPEPDPHRKEVGLLNPFQIEGRDNPFASPNDYRSHREGLSSHKVWDAPRRDRTADSLFVIQELYR